MPAHRVDVWVELGPQGWHFRWWTGRISDQRLREYTSCPGSAAETAARRIGCRVRQMRQAPSLSVLGRLEMAAELAVAAQDADPP
ncbi:hypothetical protein ABH927_005903 [Planotetraspora sp. GP83]